MTASGLVEIGSHSYRLHNLGGNGGNFESGGANGVERRPNESDADFQTRVLDDIQLSHDRIAGELGGVSREAASYLAPTDKVTYTQASVQLNWFWAYEARLTTDDPSSQPLLMDAYDTALGENGTYMVTMAPVVRMTQIDTYNTDGITADAAGAQTWADGYAPAYPDIPTVSG